MEIFIESPGRQTQAVGCSHTTACGYRTGKPESASRATARIADSGGSCGSTLVRSSWLSYVVRRNRSANTGGSCGSTLVRSTLVRSSWLSYVVRRNRSANTGGSCGSTLVRSTLVRGIWLSYVVRRNRSANTGGSYGSTLVRSTLVRGSWLSYVVRRNRSSDTNLLISYHHNPAGRFWLHWSPGSLPPLSWPHSRRYQFPGEHEWSQPGNCPCRSEPGRQRRTSCRWL